jgi:hypothetical protein
VKVQAKVTIDGTDYSLATPQEIEFGDGPLSKLRIPDGGIQRAAWAEMYGSSPWKMQGQSSYASSLPAATLCKRNPTGFRTWPSGNYSAETGLPSSEVLGSVSGLSNFSGLGAAVAAGWPNGHYWTDQLKIWNSVSNDTGFAIPIISGFTQEPILTTGNFVVCIR